MGDIGMDLILVGIVGVIGYGLYQKFFAPSPAEKQQQQAQAQAQAQALQSNTTTSTSSSAWSPALYNANPDASTLDYPTLQSIAKSIYDSVSSLPNWMVSPSSSQALAAIKQAQNQVDVSNLVIVFQQLYNEDLYDYMARNYTSDVNIQGLNQITNFVNSLPLT